MPNLKRLLILFAVLLPIALLLIVAIPVLLIQQQGDKLAVVMRTGYQSTGERLIKAAAFRPYALPPDSSLTPMDAGERMHALRPANARNGGAFVFRHDVEPLTPRWATDAYDAALFPTAAPAGWNGPSALSILEAVRGPLSPAQRAYLDSIANDPAWRTFDRIAVAPAVDVIGGQFELPFADDATWYAMPIPKFAATKEYAYASVTRAAAHLAAGRPDSAEHALRAAISFGFVMNDNAVTLIEQLIGVVIVGIGGEALQSLYTITGDSRGPALAMERAAAAQIADTATTVPSMRGLQIDNAVALTFAPCTNVRELLGGMSAAHQAEFAEARKTLARYPSEQQMFDLIERSPLSVAAVDAFVTSRSGSASTLTAMGRLAGRLTGNPRLGPCTALATGV
jgi:hypothetical protein